MIKKQKSQRRPRENARDRDWEDLYRALGDSIEWALDVAARLAASYPEEVEAIERVRAYVRTRLAGRSAQLRTADLLLAFGIIIAAIDRDLEPGPVFAPLRLACGVPGSPDVFRIPTAPELWESVVARHCPGAQTVPTRRMPHVRFVA